MAVGPAEAKMHINKVWYVLNTTTVTLTHAREPVWVALIDAGKVLNRLSADYFSFRAEYTIMQILRKSETSAAFTCKCISCQGAVDVPTFHPIRPPPSPPHSPIPTPIHIHPFSLCWNHNRVLVDEINLINEESELCFSTTLYWRIFCRDFIFKFLHGQRGSAGFRSGACSNPSVERCFYRHSVFFSSLLQRSCE